MSVVDDLINSSKAISKSLSIKDIVDEFIYRLDYIGAFVWHQSKTTESFYIKFKDERLGSIRISDHKGKEKLKYKNEVIVGEEFDFNLICENILKKTNELEDFDPNKFIVYDPYNGYGNHGIDNIKAYENFVLKRGSNKKMEDIKFNGWVKSI
jgi:hypothetical protein